MSVSDNVIKLRAVRKKPEPIKRDCESLEALVTFLREFKRKANINPVLERAYLDYGAVPLLVCNKTGRISTRIDNVISFPKRRR